MDESLRIAFESRLHRAQAPRPWPGDHIARVRGKLELDVGEQFARALGVSRMTVAQAERGEFVPKPATLQKIAAVGDVLLTWPLTGKDEGRA